MSITFYASQFDAERGYHAPMFRCDCAERWGADWDVADASGAEYPEVYSCEHCRADVNLANGNARDLISWLGVEFDYCGTVDARELAAKCRRRLWDESRNHDPAVTGAERAELMGVELSSRVIICNRRPDYLRSTTERILALAEKAGENSVSWG